MTKGAGKNPACDWFGMLGLFAIAVCLLLAVSIGVFFISVLGDSAGAPGDQTETIMLKSGDMTEAIQGIRQKDARAQTIPAAVRPDPAL